MKPSERAKALGTNVTDAAATVEMPLSTLNAWALNKPKLFKAVIVYSAIQKHKPAILKLLGDDHE